MRNLLEHVVPAGRRAATVSAIAAVVAIAGSAACGSSTPGAGAALDGSPGGEGGVGPDVGVPPTSGDGGMVWDGGGSMDSAVGQIEGGLSNSGLPPLPALTNVVATQREDSVGIDFDPVEGAVDYRVYPLPAASDLTNNSDGSLTIHNGMYRCAGLRQTFDLQNNLDADAGQGGDGGLVTFNPPWNWQSQAAESPTLGYVYVTPGPGLVPVYAVAGYPMQVELGWRESRLKIYTTDASQRQTLLAQNWRDDGIVFYAPAQASAATQTVYASQMTVGWNCTQCNSTQHRQYYFTAADLATHMGDTTAPAPAFQVLTAPADGTQPLMAVLYTSDQDHVELAVGKERFRRALYQGDGPLWHVEWAGITQPTVLVVEALKSGCPFSGFLSAQHLEAPPHQTFFTLDELQTASPTGEVFLNGQYDGVPVSPVPIARSFVQVAPQPHDPSDWDWYQGFNMGTDLGPVTKLDFKGSQTHFDCTWEGCRQQDSIFDVNAYELDNPNSVAVFTWGQFQGQFWEAFDDTGQDVTGRVRFTALQTASVVESQFLHVTMSVNVVSSDRRYPQLVLSDQPTPVDCNQSFCTGNGIGTPDSNTIIVQPIGGPSMRVETQIFHGLLDGAPWNVNHQQVPSHVLIDTDPNGGLSDTQFANLNPAAAPPFEHAGMDRMTQFDAFVSPERLYVFMDGQPAGCTQYPSGFSLSGPVTVTFGDVLYHELAPDTVCGSPRMFSFAHTHQCTETARHFDDLGFKAGVPPPASGPPAILKSGFTWDETQLPCAAY
jgi:hypothetical protein